MNFKSVIQAELYLLRRLEQAVIRRRAMEPRHSQEDHECSECEVLAELQRLRKGDSLAREMRGWEKLSDEAWRKTDGLIADGGKVRKRLESLGITEEKMLAEFEEWRKKRGVKP